MRVKHNLQLALWACLYALSPSSFAASVPGLAQHYNDQSFQSHPDYLHLDRRGNASTDATFDDTDPDSMTDDAFSYDQARWCNFGRSFSSLDEIQSASDTLSTPCIAIHTLQVLSDMLSTAYDNFTSVNDGYDAEFGYYVTYMKKLIPVILSDELMFNVSATAKYDNFASLGEGMKFFDCETSSSPGAKYPCTDLRRKDVRDLSQSETTLSLRDRNGYTKALDKVGLVQDWTDFGDFTLKRAISQPHAARTQQYKFKSFPIENSTINVPNPKDIITKGLGNIRDLQISLESTLIDAMLANYIGGSLQDAVQAYSVPVFMLIQAVDNMAQAKAIGKKEEETEREEEKKRKENLILLIITVVLMFIPVVGDEIATATGIASIARALTIVSEIGNAGLAIYDTVQDPSSALLNVLGMMFGVGSIAKAERNGKGLAEVAKVRKGMKPEIVAALGTLFKGRDDKLQTLMKSCKRPM